MNTNTGASMSKSSFKRWFAQIDTDGSDNVSLEELLVALCKLFKIEVPNYGNFRTYIPDGLLEKNEMIRTSLRKF
jgi:hypothetical protein